MMQITGSQVVSGRRGRSARAGWRRRLTMAALIVSSILLVGVGSGAPPVAADEGSPCADLPPNHPCHDVPLPPDPPPDEPPPPPDGDPPPPQPPQPQDCTNPAYGWDTTADQGPDAWADAREDPDGWPEGSLVYHRTCARNIEEPRGDWGGFPTTCYPNLADGIWEFCGQYRVFAPGENPDPPAPDEVAGWGWLCVEGWFDTPDVEVWPAPDTAVVVRTPTFVALDGEWPPFEEVSGDQAACPPGVDVEIEQGDDEVEITVTAAGITVTMVGEAQLLYDTGEPSDGDGTIVVDCEGPGRPFDPDGDPPDEQAEAAGACTHAYTSRTTPGQPWPAGLEFSWDIGAFMGDARVATFGPLTSGTTFGRQVDEVHAVVSDVGG